MRRAGLILLGLAASSCRPVEPVRFDAPAAVKMVALLSVDESGALLAASPIRAWSADESIVAGAPSDHRALIAGWDEQLPEAAIGATPRAARACEARLPAPIWAASWSSGVGLAAADPGLAPPLAVDGIELCPGFDPSRIHPAVDARCESARCPVMPLPRGTCGLDLELGCGIGTLKGGFLPDGAYCADPSTLLASGCKTTSVSVAGADAVLECDPSCELDVVLDVDAGPAPFERISLPLFGAADPMFEPMCVGNHNELNAEYLVSAGYAFDLALTADQAVVAASPGRPIEAGCIAVPSIDVSTCVEIEKQGQGRLVRFDLATGSMVGSSTAPSCLTRIASLGGRLFATFTGTAAGAPWQVGELGPDGNVISSAIIAPGVTGRTHLATAVIALDDPPRIAVVLSTGHAIEAGTFDLALAPLRIFSAPVVARPTHAILEAPNRLLLVAGRVLTRVDLINGTLEAGPSSGVTAGLAGFGILAIPSGPLLLGTQKALIEIEAETPRRIPPFMADVDVTSLAPFGGTRVIAGGGLFDSNGRKDAVTLIHDYRTHRFSPRMETIGHGVVSRMAVDSVGRIWALLPWAGELVRLTPRE